MTKNLMAILAVLGISLTAAATVKFIEGTPCPLEGERKYLANQQDGRNHDVYVCKAGVWQYFYTRTWDEGMD